MWKKLDIGNQGHYRVWLCGLQCGLTRRMLFLPVANLILLIWSVLPTPQPNHPQEFCELLKKHIKLFSDKDSGIKG